MRPTFLLAVALGCGQPRTATELEPPARPQPAGVLATVNGVPITEADLLLRSKTSAHEAGTRTERPAEVALDREGERNVLDTVIREELMAQQAVALGLDDDPGLRDALAQRQAEMDAFRRQRLAELYARHDRESVEVTDAEARRYFEDEAARLRHEVHVWQILVRDERQIEQARRDLAAGEPFEVVAARGFPNLPAEAARPWDLGFMKWTQLPEPWRPALQAMHEGQTSGVLRGPRNRFWIVKIVDERDDPAATFDTLRASILELLRAERLGARRADADRALRAGARVVYRQARD